MFCVKLVDTTEDVLTPVCVTSVQAPLFPCRYCTSYPLSAGRPVLLGALHPAVRLESVVAVTRSPVGTNGFSVAFVTFTVITCAFVACRALVPLVAVISTL